MIFNQRNKRNGISTVSKEIKMVKKEYFNSLYNKKCKFRRNM